MADLRIAIEEKQAESLGFASFDVPTLSRLAPGCALIVNTTPLGMFPHSEGNPWPEDVPFPAGAAVYDLVYNPAETALVRAARQASLKTCTGGGMLADQAALSFARWTGVEPPFEVMEKAFTQGEL